MLHLIVFGYTDDEKLQVYSVCKIKVNDAFILIYNLTPLNLSHDYHNNKDFQFNRLKTYTK